MTNKQWGGLSFSEQTHIVDLLDSSRDETKTENAQAEFRDKFNEYAKILDITPASLERYCYHYKYWQSRFQSDAMAAPVSAPVPVPEYVETVPKIDMDVRLTDINAIEKDTDQKIWIEWLSDMKSSNPYIVVKHPCDAHMPFHDPRALDIDFKLTSISQPDVIVVGSDAFDFPSISMFDKDPDVKEDFEDVLELVEYYWNWLMSQYIAVAPDAKFVFIWGNHERRLIRWLGQNAPQIRRTVLGAFRRIIQAKGVWWLGETDGVRMGPIKIEHGVNHGINAAKKNLVKSGAQISKWQGHGHRIQEWRMQGEEYSVISIMSGHLSKYHSTRRTPHYIRAAAMKGEYHTLGTAIGDVDLRSRDVTITNLEFKEDSEQRLYTRYERKTLRSVADE